MIHFNSRKWNKLRVALSNPSAVPEKLKDRWLKLCNHQHSINERMLKMQRRAYGETVSITRQEAAAYEYTEEDNRRIEYYLGDIGKKSVSLDSHTPQFHPETKPHKLLMADYDLILAAADSGCIKDGYTLPLLNLFSLLPDEYRQKKFLYRFGDYAQKSLFDGVIAKTRQCNDLSVTLLKLNLARHWKDVRNVAPRDMDYRHKEDVAVWRGATTGIRKEKGTRAGLVEKFFDDRRRFDVAFSKLVDPQDPRGHLVKDMKSMQEQLQYKFLICLEGNDVASGLKWMLQSNSVVMMPKPSVSSWVMEDKLEPLVHYIPLADDFSDAEAQVDWALSHENECMEISRNASRFMSQFMNPRKEILIEYAVFRRYLDQIAFYG